MISSSRYDEIRDLTYRILLNSNTSSKLPISMKAIARTQGIKIRSYNDLDSLGFLSWEKSYLEYGEDGALIHIPKMQSTFLFYNERKDLQRKRWTFAHELGHHFLKHKTILTNHSEENYTLCDKEADFFARNLLMPFPFLHFFYKQWGSLTQKQIYHIFNVNYNPAQFALENFNRLLDKNYDLSCDVLLQKFRPSLEYLVNLKYCCQCRYELTALKGGYCPLCGLDITDAQHTFQKEAAIIIGGGNMNYNKIPLHESTSKALICPQCGNDRTDLVGSYCQVCGVMLVNRCSDSNSCGKLLAGDARYCNFCGAESTFFNQGFLIAWNESEQQVSLEDDDLPF